MGGFWFQFFWINIPRSRIAGSDSSTFNFLRNLILFSIATALFWITTNNINTWSTLFSFLTVILTWMNRYLTVVWICISWKASNTEHFFTYLLIICMYFLEKCMVRYIDHFLIQFLNFYLLSCQISLYVLGINFLYMVCKYLLPFHKLPFHSVASFAVNN